MTHMHPMPESAGELGTWTKSERPCPKCGSPEYYWTIWASSCGGYEDEKQACRACGHEHWIDGIDS